MSARTLSLAVSINNQLNKLDERVTLGINLTQLLRQKDEKECLIYLQNAWSKLDQMSSVVNCDNGNAKNWTVEHSMQQVFQRQLQDPESLPTPEELKCLSRILQQLNTQKCKELLDAYNTDLDRAYERSIGAMAVACNGEEVIRAASLRFVVLCLRWSPYTDFTSPLVSAELNALQNQLMNHPMLELQTIYHQQRDQLVTNRSNYEQMKRLHDIAIFT